MKTVAVKETQAPYKVTVDEAALDEGPVRVVHGEETLGVLVPPDEYEAFRAWRERQQQREVLQPASEQFEREAAAFQRLLPQLLEQYRGRVVAIHGGKVVEVGDSKVEVSERVHQRLGDVVIYVQRVEEHPRVRKFPCFRVIR